MQISCLSTSLSDDKSCQEDIEDSLTGVLCPLKRVMPPRVIDLNDDCLEKILLNLNLKQLFDAATVHTRFVNACRRVFLKNYRNKEINISVYQTLQPNYPVVLDLFGDLIEHLRVTYDRHNDHGQGQFNKRIHKAIVRHCSDTLTVATFNHIQPMMEINKSFEHLESLNFNQCCVGVAMSQFNRWFPKLVSIQFFFSTTINTNCIEQTFPNLQHFTVAHQNFTFDNLRTFLDLNQQLKSFTVYNYNMNLIHHLEQYTKAKFHSLHTKFEIYPCYFAFNNQQWLIVYRIDGY